MSIRHLESLFQPTSVALIGASDQPDSLGTLILNNLQGAGFKGPIWLINPKRPRIGGQLVWPNVASLPGVPDLAVICTPAATVPALIAELGAKGTRCAIVISAGLHASASDGTRNLQQAMLDAARPHLLRVLGPNCIGLIIPGIGLNASFAPGNAQPGKLAFVTQSGALATAMLDWANSRNIGFSHFVSLGDSADVDFGDVLDYLACDASTRAILMYAESISSARKFMSAARQAARNKPVIVVKAGRASSGARAAASHTGALAGSDVVLDAAFRRAGMLRVDTLEALFDAAETLAHARPFRGDRLAILTNGGGAGVLAADALQLAGGRLATLEADTLQALNVCLPANWPHANPVDIIGDAPVVRYQQALKILLAAQEVDAVLFMHAPTAVVPADEIAQACLPLMTDSVKPILACWLGGGAVAHARLSSSQANVPGYSTPEQAVKAWMQMVDFANNQAALQQLPINSAEESTVQTAQARSLLTKALVEKRTWLDADATCELMQAYGIPTVTTRQVTSLDSALIAAAEIGYPVVLKVISSQILHKSDVGGVALNLRSDDELRAAEQSMRTQISRLLPHAQISGFTVQSMAQRPGALELIAGIASDAVFGPVLLLGRGGTQVELSNQFTVALPPLNDNLARDMVLRSQLGPLLAGYRGQTAVDMNALIDTLLKVSRMASELPELEEMDLNPLLVDANGVLALDARVKLRSPGAGELSRLAVSPYPVELEETVALGDTSFFVRPIRPQDGQRLLDFYTRADPADMRFRFFFTRRTVPHSEVARYSQIDYDREMTFVALSTDAQGHTSIAAEASALSDPDHVTAQFAIQVASDWQGKALGHLMLKKLIAYLRSRGTRELTGLCLKENTSMVALARNLGFVVSTRSNESETLSMTLAL
jgi:acetyltransferase